MVSSFRAGALSVERLQPPHLVETFGFLDRDPVLNVYLLALVLRDALGQPRDEYWVARRDKHIVGLLHLGGSSGAVLPIGDDEEALRLLGDQARSRLSSLPRRFQVIGPSHSVKAFLQRFEPSGLTPRLDRAQVYMAVERGELPHFERLQDLAPARVEDVPLLYETGADLRAEELEEDPRRTDAASYRRRVEEEARDGHTYLWKDEEGLRFRASVSAMTADAAQVSGVFTPRERRRKGFATLGLAELSRRLLDRCRAVCLFVNLNNAPALSLYHRLGFRERSGWRSLFYDASR
ncbi:MAG TPA: GNAT family N-acetyltransferase [Candidatus Eisenbacteria bacterium]|nr:GNAT family N-acetyltransferase [Candidatus Eisenbacteria bacterium]